MCSHISLSEVPAGPTRDALLTSTRPLGAPLPCPSPHRRSSSLPGMSGLGPPGSESPCSGGSPGVTAWASLTVSLEHLRGELLVLDAFPAPEFLPRHTCCSDVWPAQDRACFLGLIVCAPHRSSRRAGPPSLGHSPPVGSSLQAPGSGACSRVSTSGACPAVTGGCQYPAATEAPCHRWGGLGGQEEAWGPPRCPALPPIWFPLLGGFAASHAMSVVGTDTWMETRCAWTVSSGTFVRAAGTARWLTGALSLFSTSKKHNFKKQ